jgi:GNAT superfamily N-acetyltransferase
MPAQDIRLRPATTADAAFVVEMARHACTIEDWPLPDPDSDEVRSLLPPNGEVPIIATDSAGCSLGAVWTFHNAPPLRLAENGLSVPELCIAVTPGHRGRGIGGQLLDALFARCADTVEAISANVHLRNPSQHLYQRKAFQAVGQGRWRSGHRNVQRPTPISRAAAQSRDQPAIRVEVLTSNIEIETARLHEP